MTDTLLLRLREPSADARVEACLWAGSGSVGVAPTRVLGSLALAEAAAQAVDRRVVAVLPAGEVLALDVALPEAAPARLRASLPFALEERIAGDIDDQHCALGRRGDDGRWPVRVIARDRMEAWLVLLRAVGLEPQAMLSAADMLREKPGDLMLWIDGDETHWRAPGASPLTLPLAADAWRSGVAAALADRPRGTLGLIVHADAREADAHATAIESLRGEVAQLQWVPLTDGALSAFAPSHVDAVNLLQGSYAPRRTRTGRDAWRWPLRLAAAAVGLLLLGAALDAWRVHRGALAVDAAVLTAAQPLQPGITDPSAARTLLRERMSRWSRTALDPATAPVLGPLAEIARAKEAAPSLQVVSLSTEADGGVRARLSAADPAELTAAAGVLSAVGWRESAAEPDDDGTDGRADQRPGVSAVWRAPPRSARGAAAPVALR